MAYNIYTTRGLVLSHRSLREADRVYSILTRDLGLIRATATGVRKEASKLRGALEPLSIVSVSLVRGKEYWRLTSAVFEENLIGGAGNKKKIAVSLSRSLLLVASLIQGEDPHPELFDALVPILIFSKQLLESRCESLEILILARSLFHLGYLSAADVSQQILMGEIQEGLFDEVEGSKKAIIKAINDGIDHSSLGGK